MNSLLQLPIFFIKTMPYKSKKYLTVLEKYLEIEVLWKCTFKSTSTSTLDFSEMYSSTFRVLYKLYLSTDVLKYKVLLPGSDCRQLKFGMLIEHSVWHTVHIVKVHKNNYVSFCYRNFGNTTVKTMAEIILKCYCWHTKLTCFIGIAMKLTCYYQHT